MMQDGYEVTGTLTDARTVALDQDVPLAPAKVRVIVEPLVDPSPLQTATATSVGHRAYAEVVKEIRERQARRRHRAPSDEEVAKHLQQERDSWND